MDVIEIEAWARENAETTTYLAFFGLLFAFGIVELFVKPRGERANRPRRWSTNVILMVLWVSASALIPLSLLAAADIARSGEIGILHLTDIDPWAAITIGLIARSLISYLTHFAMHKIPVLWRIHRVHHLDPVLDISTTARFHPFEGLASAPFALFGIFVLGIPPAAVLIYEIFDAAIVVFTHANVRLPKRLDRWLSLIIVTPDMHRVHHSAFQPETDSNYGATLSIWDRLFGTYRRIERAKLDDIPLGLNEVRDQRTQHITWLLLSPFLSLKTIALTRRQKHG